MTECFLCGGSIEWDEDIISPSGKMIPLEYGSDGVPHQCTVASPRIIDCHHCGSEITFSDEHLSKNGKKLPLNPDLTRHSCEEGMAAWRATQRQEDYKCRGCGIPIHFSDRVMSKSGRFIPLESSGSKHNCSKSPFKGR